MKKISRSSDMVGDTKSVKFSGKGYESPVSEKGDASSTFKTRNLDKWHKDMVSRLLQKSKAIEQANQEIMKLIVKKNSLESKIKGKNEEIYKLNNKNQLLTKELGVVKQDYLQALEEIKVLKAKIHESARKDELIEQKKTLFNQMKEELIKTNQSLVLEKLKNQNLEKTKLNPHKWRIMQYTDPHYYELLQKKNHLQKEFQKKMNLLESKDAQIQQKDALLQKLQDMLKRRPFNLIDAPNEQMMEYYRTINLQKEKIKSLSAQVNMFESLVSDHYKKIDWKYKETVKKHS